ncbi:hypothetical protein PybrP1_009847 [[Pythium] brassicae (nom. inval.)]|nr:hypothetical protein PybrP1_009847 [[Pythium] brassicae (nom. inval.)]
MDVDDEALDSANAKTEADTPSSGPSEDDDARDADAQATRAPPKVISFAAKKRELERAKKAMAKSRKLSSEELRSKEAEARAFLIKTIDHIHVLIVKDATSAFGIFKTLCSRYEDTFARRDPHYIQYFLMEIRYEEGSDATWFFLELEQAMKATADAKNSVMNDEQKAIYLYHFIPSTPESRETSAEKALAETTSSATKPKRSCTYCHRNNHDAKDCRTLQRHLFNGTVKPGTVIPAGFKVEPLPNRPNNHSGNNNDKGKRFQPYAKTTRERSNDFKKPNDGGDDNAIFDKNGNRLDPKVLIQLSKQIEDAKRVDNGKYFQTRQSDFSILAVAAREEREWFGSMAPGGSVITVSGQRKIPIEGIDCAVLHVTSTMEVPTDIVLDGVLLAPELHYNLFSVAQGIKDDFKVLFDKSGKCSLWYQNRAKIVANTTPATGIYQFEANAKLATATTLAATGKDESFLLWHKHMGHPIFSYFQVMLKQQTVEDLSAPNINI